jgi:transposase
MVGNSTRSLLVKQVFGTRRQASAGVKDEMKEYTFVEAAERLGLSTAIIYKWEKRWKFTHKRRYIMTRVRIYTEEDIMKLVRLRDELRKARTGRTEADLAPLKDALKALGGRYANNGSSFSDEEELFA